MVGHNASLHLKVPDNKAKSSLIATIRAPDGSEENLPVQPSKDDQYRIDFLPKQPGMHAISVQRHDKHVAGLFCSDYNLYSNQYNVLPIFIISIHNSYCT